MMKLKALILCLVSASIIVPVSVQAEDGFWGWLLKPNRKSEVRPASNDSYTEECGSCHFPYQPGLLPARSWKKLMDPVALEDHFGDNAELDEDVRKPLEDFLTDNAADRSHYKRSKKIMASLKSDEAPIRITEVRYIKRKHHEMTDKYVKNNPQVKSLSYCDKCHQMADKAIYDDDTVRIPNHGDWTW